MSHRSQNPQRSHKNPDNKYHGSAITGQHDSIFKTQPDFPSHDNRGHGSSPRANNYHYAKNNSNVSNVYNSYARSLPRLYDEYKNPSTRLDDGLYAKLYAIPSNNALSTIRSPRNSNLKPYLANGGVEGNNSSAPFYVNKGEASIFDDAKFKKLMNKYDQNNSTSRPEAQEKRVHFVKDSYAGAQTSQREQDTSKSNIISTRRSPLENSKYYDLHASTSSNDNGSVFNNSSRVNGSYLQGASTDASPKTTGSNNDWSPTQSQVQPAKYYVADEIISPKNTVSKLPYWPRLEDSSKMRNPIFSSYDFSHTQKKPTPPSKVNLNHSYSNNSHVNPVSPTAYLKDKKATLAQVGVETPVVNHSFKIDSALGMIPLTVEEKQSIQNNALKTFLSRSPDVGGGASVTYSKPEANHYAAPEQKFEGIKANVDYKPAYEKKETQNVTSLHGNITMQDVSRNDYGASNLQYSRSQFGKATGNSFSLQSSPILKGGLSGKGTRGYGIFGPAGSELRTSPPW